MNNTHHRGQGRQRQNGSGPTCNHKMSTGLPDAGNRRLFRSSMRKPFSRSHCPGLGVKLLHILTSPIRQRVCCEDYYTPLGDRTSGSLAITCGREHTRPIRATAQSYGPRRIKSGIRGSGSTKRSAGKRTHSTPSANQRPTIWQGRQANGKTISGSNYAQYVPLGPVLHRP